VGLNGPRSARKSSQDLRQAGSPSVAEVEMQAPRPVSVLIPVPGPRSRPE